MEKDSSEDEMNNSSNYEDSGKDMSFVTKVRTRMSGLFNSSITRLFGNQVKRDSLVRRRDSDEYCESQPPRKRAKQTENNYSQDHHGAETSNFGGSNNSMTFTNFVEPIAGTSGLKLQSNWNKRLTSTLSTPSELSNDDKDSESGESTSGYSSMPKFSRRQPQHTPAGELNVTSLEKNKSSESKDPEVLSTPITPDRSLFSDRSLFADRSTSPQRKNTSLSSRRPSFNASSFGSPNFVDRTITTSRIINSPFYNGPTTFGGASAYDRKTGFSEIQRQQMKNSFLIKPVNRSSENKSSTSLSKTARRILETLEQYSTPMEKKKIVTTKGRKPEGLLTKYLGANPYNMRQPKVSSNKELQVPTTSELLQMKQKQKLQDTTDQIRQIATSSSSSLKSEDYKIGEDSQQQTYKNKIKTKITSVRNKTPAIEIIEEVILNPVPLAISEDKLPKFDFGLPPPPVASKTKEVEVSQKRDTTDPVIKVEASPQKRTRTEDFTSEFIFSKPLIIADNLKSIVAINNFKFSEPLCRKVIAAEKETTKVENKINNGDITRNVAQNVIENLKSKKDPLMEKFKKPEGSWECTTCLIQNKANAVKCIACETLRSKEASPKPSLPGFGIQFNMKSDEWECASCLIRNKVSSGKCVACGALKPSANTVSTKTNGFGDQFKMSSNEWECQTCLIRNKLDRAKCMACETARSPPKTTSGDGLKTINPSWRCQTCLIQNRGDVTKCIACETEKINSDNKGGFGSQFRPAGDTWECDTCLIRNKNELKSCAACQTPKDKIVPANIDTFKKSTEKWECPTCLVRNNNDALKCPCCETAKPGSIPTNTKNEVNLFNFGASKSQFSFGIPKEEQTKSQHNVPTASVPGFIFGSKSEVNDTKKEDKTSNILPELKTKVETPKFSFGNPETAPKPSDPKPDIQPIVFKSVDTNKLLNLTTATTTVTTTTTVSTNFNFGSSSSSTANIKPLITFDSSKPLVTPSENKTPAIPSIPENKPTFEAPTSKVFTFGNNTAAPAFSFGKTDVAAPSKEQVFTFGSKSTPSESKGFNFAPPSAPKSNNIGQTNSGFSFNPPKAVAPTNAFPTPVTATKNGGFNFGNPAVNNSQAAVFSFGASQNLPQAASNVAQPSTKGFNFTVPPAAPSSGFNLGAPTFDSNVKPTFNFTGGNIPTFAATPTEGGGAAPVRKFKKAVRRAAQR